MITKFCNLYGVSRVIGPGVLVVPEASSTNITAWGSSDQKLETIWADDPAMLTVCNILP